MSFVDPLPFAFMLPPLSLLSVASGLGAVADRFGVSWPLLTAQIVNFGLVMAVLYYWALRPILATLEQRQAKIREGLEYAKAMEAQRAACQRECADSLQEATEQAQALLQEAKALAHQELEHQRSLTAQRVSSMLQEAQSLMAIEQQKAVQALQNQMTHLVLRATERVLQQSLTPQQQDQFLEKAASNLEALSAGPSVQSGSVSPSPSR
jgi:F-type H+-transporting ATPase subunit b